MRNNRYDVAQLNERHQRVRFLKPQDAAIMVASGNWIIVSYAGEVLRRVRSIAPRPPRPRFTESDSDGSAASITYGDMMANIGLSDDPHAEYISEARIHGARDKIAAFGLEPSWSDCLRTNIVTI